MPILSPTTVCLGCTMLVDRFSHPQNPRQNIPSANDKALAAESSRAGLTKSPSQLAEPGPAPLQAVAQSVVLKLQFPERGFTQPGPEVYTDGRKAVTAPDIRTDVDNQATEYQRAVDRNAGFFTQITLNKDGVLVAKPQAAPIAKEADFVALAVSAMREFRDEAERQKTQSSDSNAAPTEMPWGRLKGLQQLAAKFNVFA